MLGTLVPAVVFADDPDSTPDTTAPTLSITSAPTDSATPTPTITFTDSDDVGVVATLCGIDDGALGDCSSPFTTLPLSDGLHTVHIVVRDAAGNANNDPVTFTVDTIPPVITLNGDATSTIDFGAVFTDPGATAVDAVDGTVAVTAVGSVDSSTAGTYTLTYSANDQAGNISTSTRDVIVSPAPVVVVNMGGGGGGSGGSSAVTHPPTAPVATPTPSIASSATSSTPSVNSGEVLGAFAFNFRNIMTIGSKNADVTALQQYLTSAGFYKGPITGYFGTLTKAAVMALQSANGLEAVGRVGLKTLQLLNSGSIQLTPVISRTSTATSTSTVNFAAEIAALEAQLQALQSKLPASH